MNTTEELHQSVYEAIEQARKTLKPAIAEIELHGCKIIAVHSLPEGNLFSVKNGNLVPA